MRVIGWMRIAPGPYAQERGESATGGPHPEGPITTTNARSAGTAPLMRGLGACALHMAAIVRIARRLELASPPMVRALALIALALVAGCASAPSTAPAAAQAGDITPEDRRPRIDVVLTGERPTVWIDGAQVADEHLKHSDDAVEIVSSSGDTLHRIPLPVPPHAPPVMLGARLEVPGPAIARHAGIDPSTCSIITAVLPDGPAAKSGLEAWDVVTAMAGSPVATPSAIRSALRARAPGDVITMTVRRGQETRAISITLDSWRQVPLAGELQPPPSSAAVAAPVPQGAPSNLRKGLPTAPNARDSAGRPMPVPQPAPTQP